GDPAGCLLTWGDEGLSVCSCSVHVLSASCCRGNHHPQVEVKGQLEAEGCLLLALSPGTSRT
ncbi:hypothetical protein NDU88_000337, partial [Pleurodeles waltl]